MRTDRFLTRRPLAGLTAAAAAVGTATLLLVGVLPSSAGAVAGPPFNTSTVVSTSPLGPVFTGAQVTFTAKAGSPGHGTPSGTYTFSIVGADSSVVHCSGGDTVVFTGGSASCPVPGGLLAGGSAYTVTAGYSDTADSTYLSSTGSKLVTVKQGKTTTVVTSSVNPSVTGQAVTFTAAVAPVAPALGSPSGSVTFTGVTCDGGTNVIVISGGLAQCVLLGGLASQGPAFVVNGTYSGDPQFLASHSMVKQTVAKAASTVTLAASPSNCSGNVCTVGQGNPVAFTATAATTGTDGGSGVPSGSMIFSIVKAGSKTSLMCDGSANNTVTLVAGKATCTFAGGLTASIYFTITSMLVSTGFTASSATLYENSALAGTNTTISVARGLGAGQSFTVQAFVFPVGYSGSNLPTGFVNILVCGSNSNGSNGCQGGAAPVGVGGEADFMVGGGEFPGGYSISAVYTGDNNFYSSTAHNHGLFVGKSSTTLTLSEYGGFASVSGSAVTITATVVAPDGAAGSVLIGPMSGNVTFVITDSSANTYTCNGGNAIALATSPGQVEGTATCVIPPGILTTASATGTAYAVHVNYGGDSNYGVANAHAVQMVVPAVV
jgi:hypothetical protein